MNTQNTIIGLVVLAAVIGIGWYAVSQNDGGAMMKDEMQKEGEMMQDDSMMKDDAMTEGDGMMKDDSMMKDGEMMDGGTMMEKGSYEAYGAEKLALADSGDVLLFFHADWCPTCRAIESEINAGAQIPAGVHILKVNYDKETALKQKYGVTTQHTFVQVDASGKLIQKFSDAATLAAVFAKVK
jgi:thiol-disulfide isomerase/thioredoxin